jgi:hypothetical protein
VRAAVSRCLTGALGLVVVAGCSSPDPPPPGLERQEVGVTLVVPLFLTGTALDDLWAFTPGGDLYHRGDGQTWSMVPSPARYWFGGSSLADHGGAAWFCGTRAAGPRFVVALHPDGTVEDHSAEIPPGWSDTRCRSGGGGLFVATADPDPAAGLLRLDGEKLRLVPGLPLVTGRVNLLAVVGPDEAYLQVDDAILRYAQGTFEKIPWPVAPSGVVVSALAPDDVWFWELGLAPGSPGLHRDARGLHPFTVGAATSDEWRAPLGFIPLGAGRAAILSFDCQPKCDLYPGTPWERSGLGYRPLDAAGREHRRQPLLHCPPDGCKLREIYPALLPDGTLLLAEAPIGAPAALPTWLVSRVADWP